MVQLFTVFLLHADKNSSSFFNSSSSSHMLVISFDGRRHLFPDTCSCDRCFATLVPATDVSRHLFPRQMFRDTCYLKRKRESPSPSGVKFNLFSHVFNKCREISVAKHLSREQVSRNICCETSVSGTSVRK